MRESLDDQAAQHIARLKQRLANLQSRLPAHSVPSAMMIEMEEIEDELVRLQSELEKQGSQVLPVALPGNTMAYLPSAKRRFLALMYSSKNDTRSCIYYSLGVE